MRATTRHCVRATALLGLLLAASKPSHAEIYRVDFSGYTTTFDNAVHSELAPEAGSTFTGYYIYDSSAPPTVSGQTASGYYFASPYGLHAEEGNLVFDSNVVPGLTIHEVRKNGLEDRFFVDSYSSLVDATTNQVVFGYSEAFLGFHDPTMTSLAPDRSLPITAFDPTKLSIEFFLSGGLTGAADVATASGFGLNGIVTAMTITQLSSAGFSETNPALPVITEQGTFTFNDVVSGQWFDPPITNAFRYDMTSGSLFTHILAFPSGFNDPFSVYVNGSLFGTYGVGDSVDFTTLPGGGVSSFMITGINPGVDAALADAFPLQLTFNTTSASFTMTPIPEPASIVMVGTALLLGAGAGFRRRRRRIAG